MRAALGERIVSEERVVGERTDTERASANGQAGDGRQGGDGRRNGSGRRGGGRRRGGGGEQLMVDRAEFRSYYGRPVIKAPSWSPLDIGGYFFLGGLAGAGSLLAAGAELTGRRRMARAMRISSLAAVSASAAALVHDLGRPARFANMLRVAKPTSPMSMGSWLLTAYGSATGAALAADLAGAAVPPPPRIRLRLAAPGPAPAVGPLLRALPAVRRSATLASGALGAGLATYTAVLAADTAVPAWHGARRELPFVFAASAASAASGMALLASPPGESGPARRLAVASTAAEAVGTRLMRRSLGPLVSEVYEQGRGGRLMRAAEILSATGAAGAAVGGLLPAAARRGTAARVLAGLSGAALLAGSVCTRLGVFHAGIASAEDPVYTVVPQRERLAAAESRAKEAAAKSEAGTADGPRRG